MLNGLILCINAEKDFFFFERDKNPELINNGPYPESLVGGIDTHMCGHGGKIHRAG